MNIFSRKKTKEKKDKERQRRDGANQISTNIEPDLEAGANKIFPFTEPESDGENKSSTDRISKKRFYEILEKFSDKNPHLTIHRIRISTEFLHEVIRQEELEKKSRSLRRTRSEYSHQDQRSPRVIPSGTLERQVAIRATLINRENLQDLHIATSKQIKEVLENYSKRIKSYEEIPKLVTLLEFSTKMKVVENLI